MKVTQNSYANFLRSRVKARIEFIENYTNVFPQLILDENLNYLKSSNVYQAKNGELEYMLNKITEIEAYMSSLLKSFSFKVSN